VQDDTTRGEHAPVDVRRPEELLARVAHGDREAFADLYEATVPRVLGLIRRILVDPAQSEEVAQEVYLEIWQTAGRFETNKGSATTWMLTMAHRRAIDRIRSSQSGRDRDLRIGIRDYRPDVDDVAEQAEIRLENERVRRAMQRLTELQREAITLAYYEGFTQSEIADRLRIPLGTVKTRLRDGMIRLRDEMGVAP
jgi:RNA polymerase sigma-70 factor (ECF subfamily)